MGAYIIAAVLAGVLLGLGFGLWRAERAFLTFRGMRVLACPESRQPAAVELTAWRASLTGIFGRPAPRVRECSRWPERSRCNQVCVQEIRAAPAKSLVETILSNWTRYNVCVSCGAPLAKMRVGSHQPHLMSREMRIFEWKEIPPQDIPRTLRDSEPVCETCLVAETHTW